MKQISVSSPPPPLPPKTRSRSSPPEEETTVPERSVVVTGTADGIPSDSAFISHQPDLNLNRHVVKIHINPEESILNEDPTVSSSSSIRISVNNEEMIATSGISEIHQDKSTFFYYGSGFNGMSSGQISPSDTLDSGTCSDMDGTPPPLPKKKSSNGVTVTLIQSTTNQNKRLFQQEDSDNDSNISCDSLNSSDSKQASAYLPQGLLKDIRERSSKITTQSQSPNIIDEDEENTKILDKPIVTKEINNLIITKKIQVDENSYQSRKELEKEDRRLSKMMIYDTDKYYKFHLNENVIDPDEEIGKTKKNHPDDEYFAGYKDFSGAVEGPKTIRSAKGTVRGVKNRVRAGIATFLQINSTEKTYKEKDGGKVVVYTTTMGIVRETYNSCAKVKQILRTLLVKYEERDVFMSSDYQAEVKERMRLDHISVPQVFVDGQYIGDAEAVERLNESGELRLILKPYKSMDVCTTCQVCGGYRLLPCPVCNGSKKSVHRNHFTTEFVALKCMNCDEVGLVKCNSC
nr:glutaredoxin domain-containing cysteine-rich protein CG31559-like [Onthophagus taurus]